MSYYQEIIEVVRETFLRYKGVRVFRYQDRLLNNAQGNEDEIQVFCDSQTLSQFNVTTNIAKMEMNIFILRQPSDEKPILVCQDDCYLVAANVVAKLDVLEDYRGILSVYDWSIVTVDHVTDNDSAGVRLTLVLSIPNPANLCEDVFNPEPYSGDTDYDVDVPYDEPDRLDINPITLPKNPIRC